MPRSILNDIHTELLGEPLSIDRVLVYADPKVAHQLSAVATDLGLSSRSADVQAEKMGQALLWTTTILYLFSGLLLVVVCIGMILLLLVIFEQRKSDLSLLFVL